MRQRRPAEHHGCRRRSEQSYRRRTQSAHRHPRLLAIAPPRPRSILRLRASCKIVRPDARLRAPSTVERLPTGGNLQMGRSTWLQPLLAGAGLLTVAAASADAAAPADAAALTGAHRFHYDHVLGTSLDVIAVGGEGAALVAVSAALAEIDRLERILSGWRADSELAALNAAQMATVSSDQIARAHV